MRPLLVYRACWASVTCAGELLCLSQPCCTGNKATLWYEQLALSLSRHLARRRGLLTPSIALHPLQARCSVHLTVLTGNMQASILSSYSQPPLTRGGSSRRSELAGGHADSEPVLFGLC